MASDIVSAIDKKTYGQMLARDFLSNSMKGLLGEDLVYAPPKPDRYVRQATFAFEKYDDGWQVVTKQQ